MRKSKIQYILTWVAFTVMIIFSTLQVVLAWNSQIFGSVSPSLITVFWIGITLTGIFLFMLAVKKAHRLYVNEKLELEKEAGAARKKPSKRAGSSRENKALDSATTARKIVRRIPDNIAPDQLGKLLLKSLARELEIMSGVYYVEKRGKYVVDASYAISSATDTLAFKSGEGLPGQVAKNQQLMVLTSLPEGYLEVYSGLGKAPPSYLAIVPLVHKGLTLAVLECSGYRYEPGDIESMFKIFTRDLMDKLSLNLV